MHAAGTFSITVPPLYTNLGIERSFQFQHIRILLWINVLIRKVDNQALNVDSVHVNMQSSVIASDWQSDS